MLHLFILRHGKATNYQEDRSDFERHLNKKGVAQVNLVGHYLKMKGDKINKIVSSSAVRTTETAEIMNHHLQCGKIDSIKDLYLADYKTIRKTIESYSKTNHLLYVGHNDGISAFVSNISGQNIVMSTSELIVLQFEFDNLNLISQGSGKIIDRFIPDVLVF